MNIKKWVLRFRLLDRTPLLLGAGVLLLMASPSKAQTFTDTFNRANTASPNGGLGSNYTIPVTTTGTLISGDLYINNDSAAQGGQNDNVAIYNGFSLSSSFSESMTFQLTSTGYDGLDFNYQDSTDFFELRIKDQGTAGLGTFQFVQVNGGTLSIPTALTGDTNSGNLSADLAFNTKYILTVSSTATAGSYSFTLTNATGTVTYASDTFGTAALATQGVSGLAGFDLNGSSSTDALVSDFSVTSDVPEPATWVLLLGSLSVLLVLNARKEMFFAH